MWRKIAYSTKPTTTPEHDRAGLDPTVAGHAARLRDMLCAFGMRPM